MVKTNTNIFQQISQIIKKRDIKDSTTLTKIRNKTIPYLQNGELLPLIYMELFENFCDTSIEPDPYITQLIQQYENKFSKSSAKRKLILAPMLFSLAILNGHAKEGLKEFIKQTFAINLHKYANLEYTKIIQHYLMHVHANEELFFETITEMLDPTFFFAHNLEERKSLLINTLQILWNNPLLFNNKKWLSIFEDGVVLLRECRKQNLIEEHMHLHFFLYHIYGNNIQTIDEWRKFNECIEKPASKFYSEYGKEKNLPKSKMHIAQGKKRIGILIDRIVLNSPYMVLYSLLENLVADKNFTKEYELFLYSMNYIDKHFDRENLIEDLTNLGIRVYSPYEKFKKDGYYYSHIEKAIDIRNQIIQDQIDYLIVSAGYDINNFIVSNRSAPIQLYWSHGNCAFNIPNIDKRISHFSQECEEFTWEIFHVPMSEKFLIGTPEEKEAGLKLKQQLKEHFGEDTIFLGTIGRLIKIESEEYIKVIAQIMRENLNTVYLACGSGNVENIKKLMQKYGIDLQRVLFPGNVNPHIFGWVIDVWINTYPLFQGVSQEEYHAKGNGIVIQSEVIINCKYDSEFFEKEFLTEKPEVYFNGFEVEKIDNNISYNQLILQVYKKHNNVDEKEILKCIEKIDFLKNCRQKWLQTISCICQNKEYKKMYKWMTYKLWKEHIKWKNSHNEFLDILQRYK